MNLTNLAIILTATSVSASANIASKPAESTVPVDHDAVLKVKSTVLEGRTSFYNDNAGTCYAKKVTDSTKKQCTENFAAFSAKLAEDKVAAVNKLKTEKDALYEIVDAVKLFKDDSIDPGNKLGEWAKAALKLERTDWNAVTDAVKDFEDCITTESLRKARLEKMRNEAGDKNGLVNKAVSEIIKTDSSDKDSLRKFKKWIIAAKLFDNQSQSEMINSTDIDSVLQSLNVPADRFSISKIDGNLNLHNIMETKKPKSVHDASLILSSNLEEFSKTADELFKKDLILRRIAAHGLFGNGIHDADDINLELIQARLDALRRVVEGIILSVKDGKDPVNGEMATKAIKVWLMARQMGEADGWKNEKMLGEDSQIQSVTEKGRDRSDSGTTDSETKSVTSEPSKGPSGFLSKLFGSKNK